MQNKDTLYTSWQIQRRVIHALVMREIITRYGRHNVGFVWLFAEPMMFTLGIMAMWSNGKFSHGGSTIPVAAFAITGYSAVLMWRNTATRCTKAVESNLALMYHRNVKVFDIFLSRVILEVLATSISFILLTAVFSYFGFVAAPYDMFFLVVGWLLLAWFSLALGLLVGCISEQSELFERVWHVVTYLLFPMSGAIFMADWLPPKFQSIVLWLPMVQGTEAIRHGFFGNLVQTHENLTYFFTINLVLTLIGLLLTQDVQRKVQPE